MSDESIKPPAASNSLAPSLNYINTNVQVNFDGSCLKQEKITFTDKKEIHIYTVYEIKIWVFAQATY